MLAFLSLPPSTGWLRWTRRRPPSATRHRPGDVGDGSGGHSGRQHGVDVAGGGSCVAARRCRVRGARALFMVSGGSSRARRHAESQGKHLAAREVPSGWSGANEAADNERPLPSAEDAVPLTEEDWVEIERQMNEADDDGVFADNWYRSDMPDDEEEGATEEWQGEVSEDFTQDEEDDEEEMMESAEADMAADGDDVAIGEATTAPTTAEGREALRARIRARQAEIRGQAGYDAVREDDSITEEELFGGPLRPLWSDQDDDGDGGGGEAAAAIAGVASDHFGGSANDNTAREDAAAETELRAGGLTNADDVYEDVLLSDATPYEAVFSSPLNAAQKAFQRMVNMNIPSEKIIEWSHGGPAPPVLAALYGKPVLPDMPKKGERLQLDEGPPIPPPEHQVWRVTEEEVQNRPPKLSELEELDQALAASRQLIDDSGAHTPADAGPRVAGAGAYATGWERSGGRPPVPPRKSPAAAAAAAVIGGGRVDWQALLEDDASEEADDGDKQYHGGAPDSASGAVTSLLGGVASGDALSDGVAGDLDADPPFEDVLASPEEFRAAAEEEEEEEDEEEDDAPLLQDEENGDDKQMRHWMQAATAAAAAQEPSTTADGRKPRRRRRSTAKKGATADAGVDAEGAAEANATNGTMNGPTADGDAGTAPTKRTRRRRRRSRVDGDGASDTVGQASTAPDMDATATATLTNTPDGAAVMTAAPRTHQFRVLIDNEAPNAVVERILADIESQLGRDIEPDSFWLEPAGAQHKRVVVRIDLKDEPQQQAIYRKLQAIAEIHSLDG